jgi:transcriptional regulator with XRE-family HTH domain
MSEQNNGLMRSLAEELRQEREHKGISLDTIADSTKINIRFLKAIEQGDLNCIEEPYMRIFLGTYAREIGLDLAPILERYDKMKGQQEEPAVLKKGPQPPETVPRATKETPSSLRSNRTIGILAAGLLVLIIVGVRLFGTQPEVSQTQTPALPAQKAPTSGLPESTAIEGQPASQVSEGTRPGAATLQGVARDNLVLEGTAREDTWVEVEADGAPIFAGTLKEGQRGRWTAKDAFTLTPGRPVAIDLVLNGKDIPVPEENWPSQAFRLRITREGVEVLPRPTTKISPD